MTTKMANLRDSDLFLINTMTDSTPGAEKYETRSVKFEKVRRPVTGATGATGMPGRTGEKGEDGQSVKLKGVVDFYDKAAKDYAVANHSAPADSSYLIVSDFNDAQNPAIEKIFGQPDSITNQRPGADRGDMWVVKDRRLASDASDPSIGGPGSTPPNDAAKELYFDYAFVYSNPDGTNCGTCWDMIGSISGPVGPKGASGPGIDRVELQDTQVGPDSDPAKDLLIFYNQDWIDSNTSGAPNPANLGNIMGATGGGGKDK